VTVGCPPVGVGCVTAILIRPLDGSDVTTRVGVAGAVKLVVNECVSTGPSRSSLFQTLTSTL
jgi:hypothetical protein